jgi:CHAT domain-containing protein/tetratricopeptide (TPR) repeat protein
LALLGNLATLYHELGEMRAAVDMLSTTYLLREERDGVNDRKTLLVLNNLAHALRTAGRSEEALKLFEESYSRYRKALGDRDVDTLRAQHNLGSERCFDALHPDCGLLREAARVKAEVLGPTHPETLFSRSNLGVALLNQGQAAEALPELEAVYQGRLAAMTARHWSVVASKGVLSSALALTGKREEGLAGLRESNDELERLLGPTHERTLTGLWGLARTCGRLRDLDCQRQALIDMVNRAESVRGVEALRGEAQSRAIRQLTPGYRQLARIQAADGQIDAAIETIERSKARGLLAAIGLRSAETHRGLPKESLQKLADLDRRIAVLADERQRAAEPARVAELELQQSRLADEAARVREELRRTFPRYGAASRIAVPSVKLLASALAADELFLGYAALDDGFLAYTVSSRGVRNVWFLPTPQVRSMVESWRGTLTQQDPLPLWRRPDGSYLASPLSPGESARAVSSAQLGSELASRLIGPLQAQLGAYRRWIVSPDGVLATLPFETLPWKGSLVASTVEVRYAQSLSVYRLLRNRPAEQTLGLMAMGGPTYARGNTDNSFASIEQRFQLRSGRASNGRQDSSLDRAGLQWQPLPGAAREARDVAALFSASRVFVGDDASEDKLQALNASGELQHFRYLLFATHGVLSMEVPSQSAIVLRQPGSAAADGYVTAAEFSGYSFRSELIVLSACETGLGREVAGEGVMGLPYALFIAGNRNTLLSLWKVPDDSTAHFMQRFFTRLRAGVPQATALAQTRREMAASTRYRNPIHWAGFVLYGA